MSLENVIEFPSKKKVETTTKASQSTAAPSSNAPSLNLSNLGTPHPDTGLKYSGFIPLRCLFFAPEFLRGLPPGEVILFLYLTFLAWRYPTKEGYVRASLSYLVEGTGLGRTAIHGYLSHLESLKLIVCLEVNYKAGNLYRIQDLLIWKGESESEKNSPPDDKPKNELPPSTEEKGASENPVEQSEIRTAPVQISDGSSSNSEQEQSEKRTEDYTSLNSSILSYSLSEQRAENTSELLKNYFSNIKAYKKKQSEEAHFSKLRENFEVSKIFEALDYLQKYGAGTGEPCHSPMAYLSRAMEQVQKLVDEKTDQAMKAEETKKRLEELKNAQANEEFLEEAEFEQKKAAFERSFPTPDDQERYFQTFSKKYSGLSVCGMPLRNIGISAWWAEQRASV